MHKLHATSTSPEDLPNVERLILIVGPMHSGKSEELDRLLRIYSLYTSTVAVNTLKDDRYGTTPGIKTHAGRTTKGLGVEKLTDLRDGIKYETTKVIGIDEANHFDDVDKFIQEELETTNKTFIVAGLSSDKNMNVFGTFLNLVPMADKIIHLTAVCKRCGDGTPAPFNVSLVEFEGQVKIGGQETYESVCRHHFTEIKKRQLTLKLKTSIENGF